MSAQSLSAYLKETYANEIAKLVPDSVQLLKRIPFKQDEKVGAHYLVPVQLTGEHGFSAGGSGLIALNAALAHVASQASIDPKQLILRSVITYDQAARASSSKQAFQAWADGKLIPMAESFNRRLEFNCLYGNSGLGTVESNTSGALLISLATWAPGAFVGLEGAIVQAFTAVSGGSQHDGDLTITAVDVNARTVTVSGTNSSVVANDILFIKGCRTLEMDGLNKVITATSSQFGIDPSAYSLWAGNSYSAGSAPLTMGKVQSAVAMAVNKGLDEEVIVLVSPGAFANLNSNEAALRQYGAAKNGENGFETLKFYSVNGMIEIVPSINVKQGDAFVIPYKQCMRVGSIDVTMKMPGMQSEDLVLQVPDYNAYEMRMFTEQQIFCRTPGKCVKITGIING